MLLNELAELLQNAGLGVLGENIFIGQKPPEMTNAIVLNQYGGSTPEVTSKVEYVNVQVMVFAERYADGYNLISDIFGLLHTNRTANSKLIKAKQSPAFIGFDENSNPIFVCNFEVIKEV